MTDARLPNLHRAFDLTPARALLLLCLYDAKGATVPHDDILDHISWEPYEVGIEVVKVQVWGVRKAIGFNCIKNIHGKGYRLTPEGMDKVRSALGEQAESVAA